MRDLKGITIARNAELLEVMRRIDANSMQIALVTDEHGKLVGTVTDGDIRRGLLSGLALSAPAEAVMNRKFTSCRLNQSKEHMLNVLTSLQLLQLPILDANGVLVGLETLEDLVRCEKRENPVVIMAGGLGSRLGELTKDKPKPMLMVGNRPILHTIVENFAKYGFTDITLCVNYKSHVIENYFKDGGKFGVEIRYIREERRMGTAGALGLLPARPKAPAIVMNGDILTNVNFESLAAFHQQSGAPATMSVRAYDLQVPYGVVDIEQDKIVSLSEKPVHQFFVNAGIYVLDPSCMDHIPGGEYFDMTTLFEKLMAAGTTPATYLVNEYWLDIGHVKDYQTANEEYYGIFP